MVPRIKKIITSIPYKDISIILLCGSLLSLSFIKYQLGWIILVGAVPFFWYLDSLINRELTNKQFYARIWCVGVVFFAITLSWIYSIRATDLLSDPWLRWLFLFLTLAIIVIVFSIGFLFFALILRKLKINLDNPISFVIIPALWVVGEYIRSFLFSIVSFGSGASLGDYWNFGNFGFGASVTPMVYAGRLVGFYGISFLVVLLNLAIFQLVFGKLKKPAIIALLLVLSVPSLGYLIYKNPINSKSSDVGLVFMESDYTINTKYQIPLKESIIQKATITPELLVMPEYSGFLDKEDPQTEDQEISDMIFGTKPDGRVFSSQSVYATKGRYNSVVMLDSVGTRLEVQNKQFLIPGGELIPYLYQSILVASGNPQSVEFHRDEKSLLKGEDPAKPIVVGDISYGVLACSGAIAPGYYRQLSKDGAQVLVNVASIASMGLDGLYFEQSKQMAQFMAVSNSRSFLQSAKGGQSYVIDRNGVFVLESHGKDTQYFEHKIRSDNTVTAYTFLGEWLLLASSIGLGIYSFCYAARR